MPIVRRRRAASLAAVFAFALSSGAAWASTYKVLHTFQGGPNDGAHPMGTLIGDAKGNLYGTTYDGGANKAGTAFELSPPTAGHTAWTETILHDFYATPEDGTGPAAGLYMDQNGALYGTTPGGGATDGTSGGTVFKLTPPAVGQTAWTETILFAFVPVKGDVHTGQEPLGPVTMDAAGALYGTTFRGGIHDNGTVFKLTPPASGTGMWTQTILYQFPPTSVSRTISSRPSTGLVVDKSGVIFGVADGTVGDTLGWTAYSLTPPVPGKLYYTYAELGTFASEIPPGGLTADSKGNLYVTGSGGIYRIAPSSSGSAWIQSTLHAFGSAPPDGAYPYDPPSIDKNGNLFYSTNSGGAYNEGGIFELTPPNSVGGAWVETRLRSGTNSANGRFPVGGVLIDLDGNVFGTMEYGGSATGGKNGTPNGDGVVFEIKK